MKKVMLTAAVAATVLSLATITYANDAIVTEKCVVSKVGEPEVTVLVPIGECEKVQRGDFSGVSEDVKATVEGVSK